LVSLFFPVFSRGHRKPPVKTRGHGAFPCFPFPIRHPIVISFVASYALSFLRPWRSKISSASSLHVPPFFLHKYPVPPTCRISAFHASSAPYDFSGVISRPLSIGTSGGRHILTGIWVPAPFAVSLVFYNCLWAPRLQTLCTTNSPLQDIFFPFSRECSPPQLNSHPKRDPHVSRHVLVLNASSPLFYDLLVCHFWSVLLPLCSFLPTNLTVLAFPSPNQAPLRGLETSKITLF